jgi:hypothetical protein
MPPKDGHYLSQLSVVADHLDLTKPFDFPGLLAKARAARELAEEE